MSERSYQIVVADEVTSSSRRMEHVLRQLREAGLADAQCLTSLGIVTGQADASDERRLASVEGVEAVEVAGEMEIPEPELRRPIRGSGWR